MLAGGRAAALPTAKNLGLPIDELSEEFEILVINEHRPRPGTVDKDRIASLDL